MPKVPKTGACGMRNPNKIVAWDHYRLLRDGVEPKLSLLLAVLRWTACRINEALHIEKRDLTLLNDWHLLNIQIEKKRYWCPKCKSKIYPDYLERFARCKGCRVRVEIESRKVPIPPELWNELNRVAPMAGRIFDLCREAFYKQLTKACKRLGLPHYAPHSFKHTRLTELVAEHDYDLLDLVAFTKQTPESLMSYIHQNELSIYQRWDKTRVGDKVGGGRPVVLVSSPPVGYV